MATILSDIPFLKDVPARALRAAERDAKWFSLPGGWPLFTEGDTADAIYFVRTGSLGAFRQAPDGRSEFIGHIRSGEPVGEMAMMAGEPHNNSVFAMRDSEILKLSRPAFMRLMKAEPDLMERLTRVILIRLRQARRRNNTRAEPKVFALAAASPTIDLALRARAIANCLVQMGLKAVIVGEEAVDRPTTYFDALEAENDIVILTTTIGDSRWFRLAFRQADRIWVLGRSDARPSTPLMPADPSPARQFRLVDVVIIHHGRTRQRCQPERWREAADAARIFNWDDLDPDDTERLARIMAGRSVGVVLSGGGARAYAHIGLVRAMRERNVPMDFIGGSSMGAVVAACVAMGWDDDEIDRRIRAGFVTTNPLGDFRLPVVSLVKGRRVDRRLKEHFGDVVIGDMELPFFAVSTNLTEGAFRVHVSGSLRNALRASIALPGILPPVVENGHVLVDGAVLNNFPVDVMRDLHRGYIIGCDVARTPSGLQPEPFDNPPNFAGWVSRHGFRSAPPIGSLLMRAATVSVNPNQGRELTDLLILPELPEIDLRDWKAYDEAVEEGYRLTMDALDEARGGLARLVKARS